MLLQFVGLLPCLGGGGERCGIARTVSCPYKCHLKTSGCVLLSVSFSFPSVPKPLVVQHFLISSLDFCPWENPLDTHCP